MHEEGSDTQKLALLDNALRGVARNALLSIAAGIIISIVGQILSLLVSILIIIPIIGGVPSLATISIAAALILMILLLPFPLIVYYSIVLIYYRGYLRLSKALSSIKEAVAEEFTDFRKGANVAYRSLRLALFLPIILIVALIPAVIALLLDSKIVLFVLAQLLIAAAASAYIIIFIGLNIGEFLIGKTIREMNIGLQTAGTLLAASSAVLVAVGVFFLVFAATLLPISTMPSLLLLIMGEAVVSKGYAEPLFELIAMINDFPLTGILVKVLGAIGSLLQIGVVLAFILKIAAYIMIYRWKGSFTLLAAKSQQ